MGQFLLKLLLNRRYRQLKIKCPIILSGTVNIKKSLSDQNFSSAKQRPYLNSPQAHKRFTHQQVLLSLQPSEYIRIVKLP